MYVCLCKAITDESILKAIEDGACTLEDVARRCKAGTGCGGCRPAILALLREHADGGARTEGATVTPIRQGGEGRVDERERASRRAAQRAADP